MIAIPIDIILVVAVAIAYDLFRWRRHEQKQLEAHEERAILDKDSEGVKETLRAR